jgi:dTDP-4-amino-4,6-dideoxygalactose transaminase
VWHLYVVRHPKRDELANCLSNQGIGTMIHYPIPPHRQPAYSHLGIDPGSLPTAEAMAAEVLSLPIGPTMTMEQAEAVVAAVVAATTTLEAM